MAKGKKKTPGAEKKTDDTPEQKVSNKETKENKPSINKDAASKAPSILQSLRKPRSPLSDSSGMLIQEGNDSEATPPDATKVKKDATNETTSDSNEPKEKTDLACQSHRLKTQARNTTLAADRKGSTPKTKRRPGCAPRVKKTENNTRQNRKVTDFYPIRRSNRKTKGELKSEEHKHINDLIKNGIEDGMQMRHIEGKGRGVFAVNGFKKGDFVVEYHGELLDLAEAKEREAKYTQDPQTGCYMYYFQYESKTYCVDATMETNRLGRLINHSKSGNCQTRLHAIDGVPHLILVASKDVKADEELLYDYGDRSKASILAHPWLKH